VIVDTSFAHAENVAWALEHGPVKIVTGDIRNTDCSSI